MILNEYIKYTQTILLPLYLKLYSKVYDSGIMPSEWLVGMIVQYIRIRMILMMSITIGVSPSVAVWANCLPLSSMKY